MHNTVLYAVFFSGRESDVEVLHDEVRPDLLVPAPDGAPAQKAGVAGRPLLQDVWLNEAVQAPDDGRVLGHVAHGVVAQVEHVALHRVADEAGVGAGRARARRRAGAGRHRRQVGGELVSQVHRLHVGQRLRLRAPIVFAASYHRDGVRKSGGIKTRMRDVFLPRIGLLMAWVLKYLCACLLVALKKAMALRKLDRVNEKRAKSFL